MKRFTEAGRKAIAEGNLYSALSMALIIPDICASLEDPGPGKSRARYTAWCKKWLEPKFTSDLPNGPHVFISAEDCFQLRCSLIHSGTAEIDPKTRHALDRFLFFDRSAGSHMISFGSVHHNGVSYGSVLQLKADEFSDTIYSAAEEWDAAVLNDPQIQNEKAKLLIIHSAGAVIHGIEFS